MLYTAVTILNGFVFLSTLVVSAWTIFPTLVAGYLTFLDN